MILQMRKERLSADIDQVGLNRNGIWGDFVIMVSVSQVNTAHQAKLEELKTEISEVDRKSSENCVVSSFTILGKRVHNKL